MPASVAGDQFPEDAADPIAAANNLIDAFWTEALLMARLAMAAPDSPERADIQAQLAALRRRIDELDETSGQRGAPRPSAKAD